ncbi:MAG: peptidoglycan DD-metalloendopeptidase family protein [Desulfovibrio alaskensis]|jgi:murein DD-endopeptidase MepM/ murein hydrolase activator NlpD|nr:peptidoglycan DD-metalloendopeptidase family protein [Oleidesulfovibrio alaskensis]
MRPVKKRNTLRTADTRKKRLAAGMAVVVLCLVIVTGLFLGDEDTTPEAVTGGVQQSMTEDVATPEMPPVPVPETITGTIQPGDTVSGILENWLSPAEVYSLARQCDDVFSLSRIKAGQPWSVTCLQDELQSFRYEIDDTSILTVARDGDIFHAAVEPIPYDIQLDRVEGKIESNLFTAVENAGEGAALAYRLADIFMWEVDFIRDIREGDSFTVVVEKRYREGEFKGYGRILAARFVNQDTPYEGFLLEDGGRGEYYTADGKSLRKAFLKAPLDFRRISSGYSNARLHPVLNIVRPHHGIDYAAPTGTPIKAIGSGTVVAVARTKAAGKYVKIRHMNGYESAYLHMSRYARGIRSGQKVAQGQVIGYVGATGYATGPHLDFRMKRYGKYLNPSRVTNPRSQPVSRERMDEFMTVLVSYKGYLDGTLALQTYGVDNTSSM